MPRGVDLFIPFPSRISPDAGAADARHLAWPCSFGLLRTEAARQRHARARYADLGARFQPSAVGADLDLSVDQMSWFFILDDLLDDPRGPSDRALAVLDGHLSVLDHGQVPDAEPLVAAFADLWRRSRDGMSPAWQARAAEDYRRYLTNCGYEAGNRYRSHRLSAPDHLRMRRGTVGAEPILDMAERTGRFEVPQRALTSERLDAMRWAIVEVVVIQNELCSVEKEEAVGDPNNIVLILEAERSCSRSGAVEAAVDMIRQRMTTYLVLERDLPGLCDELNLAPGERAATWRYADAMRALARGAYDWSELSGRYARRDQLPPAWQH